MQEHVRILGILYIVFGALGLLAALVLFAVFGLGGALVGAAAARDPDAVAALPFIGIIGTFVVGLVAVMSLPGLIAGMGLLKYRPWARILTIVLSALHLFSVPVGTALGAYGLWVLLNNETEQIFLHPPLPQPPTYPAQT